MKETPVGSTPNFLVEIALLGLLALMWGSSYLLIKVAVETIPPITLVAVRVSIAAMFLFMAMKLRGEKLPADKRTWQMLFVQSFLNSIGAWTVLAWGQQYVDSGLATILNSTSPVFVFFFTLFFTQHEATNWLKLFGATLGITGVVLIVGTEAFSGIGQQVYAQLAVLSGAVMYGGAAIYGKNFSHMPPTVTATATMLWASIFLVPTSLLLEQPWQIEPSFLSIIATIVLSLLCTGVALLIYFRLLRTLGSIGTASQAYLRIGVGVILGVVVLGETITSVMAVGLVCAVLGVAAINYRQRG